MPHPQWNELSRIINAYPGVVVSYLAGNGGRVKVLLVVHVFPHFLSELPNIGLKLVQEVGRYSFILSPQAPTAEQRVQTRIYRVDQLLVLLVVVTDGAGLVVADNMISRSECGGRDSDKNEAWRGTID